MALGEFTKQIAQQAILSATAKDPPSQPQPAPQENLSAIFLAQINAMQRALKEEEELAVFYQNGPERLRVLEIFTPAKQVIVLTGTDADRNLTRALVSAESLQLVCKVLKVQPGAKPARVALITPRPKDSNG